MSTLSIAERRANLSDDARAVIEWTPRDGEQMNEYIDRLSSAATCGNDDALAALEGVFNSSAFKFYCPAVAHLYRHH